MKAERLIHRTPRSVAILATALLNCATANSVPAQGTVTFNDPWANDGISYFGLNYFDGMSFRLGTPPPHDGMMQIGATGPAGFPHNGTPYIAFVNTLGTAQSVIFAWTNAASMGQSFLNGAPFGLISVDLADPVAPSLTPVSVIFNGFKTDGSTVSQTFIAGGGGSSTFQTFQFNTDFALGLARVEIPSPFWAMDNLVFTVPEPSVGGLFLLGSLAIAANVAMKRRRSSN